MLFLHQLFEPLHDVRIFRCQIVALGRVFVQVVKFDLQGIVVLSLAEHFLADRFPLARPNRLLSPISGKLPVQRGPDQGAFSQQVLSLLEAIVLGGQWFFRLDQSMKRNQPVLKTRHPVRNRTRFDFARPLDDQGHPYASLVKRSLESAQVADTLEEIVIHFKFQVCRSVVGSEDYDSVLGQAEFLDQIEHPANVGIHPRDHGGIGGSGGEVRGIAITLMAAERRIVPFLGQVGLEVLIRDVQSDVRNQSRIIKEEGFVLVLPDELEGLVVDAVGSVFLALEHVVASGVVRIGSLGEEAWPGTGGSLSKGTRFSSLHR